MNNTGITNLEGYFIKFDDKGNFRLNCFSQHKSGRIQISRSAIETFFALPGGGEKVVVFRNLIGRVDAVLYEDEFGELDLIDDGDGRPYYLVGPDSLKFPRRSWHATAWPE